MATERNVLAEGTKYDGQKLRWDLLPYDALEEVARVYSMGAAKYGDYNWAKGIAYSRIYAALMRHLVAWWRGEAADPDNGQPHLASVVWNALTLLAYTKRNMQAFDDRPREGL